MKLLQAYDRLSSELLPFCHTQSNMCPSTACLVLR
jgi:hypothetical protein